MKSTKAPPQGQFDTIHPTATNGKPEDTPSQSKDNGAHIQNGDTAVLDVPRKPSEKSLELLEGIRGFLFLALDDDELFALRKASSHSAMTVSVERYKEVSAIVNRKKGYCPGSRAGAWQSADPESAYQVRAALLMIPWDITGSEARTPPSSPPSMKRSGSQSVLVLISPGSKNESRPRAFRRKSKSANRRKTASVTRSDRLIPKRFTACLADSLLKRSQRAKAIPFSCLCTCSVASPRR